MNHVIVSCKSPPHVRTCINSGSPFGHALTHVPAFGYALTQGVNKCILFCFLKWFHVIASSNDVIASYFNWSGKCSSWTFIWGTTRYGSFDFKISPWGTPFLTLALTTKVVVDRPSKLNRLVADHMLLSHQV
jgi:hypothetical protein